MCSMELAKLNSCRCSQLVQLSSCGVEVVQEDH